MEAIDRLHTTADSHHRVLIVEVMGRHAGWIAFHAGLAGGANVILIPERQFDVDAGLRARRPPLRQPLRADHRRRRGGRADGRHARAPKTTKLDAFGHVRLGGVGHWLEGEIERRTGKKTRGRPCSATSSAVARPTAFDRVLATRFGLHAIDAAEAGRWGTTTALRGTEIELVQLTEATGELKTVPESLYAEAEVFFG